jgi:hypothetical protein
VIPAAALSATARSAGIGSAHSLTSPVSERSEQIYAKDILTIEDLEQQLAFGRMRMNVIQPKQIGE